MPIQRLFKRASTGLDTVDRAIQGHRDRFKARWDSLDKQAQFSSDEVATAYNAAKELIADGWDEESVSDQMYTAYGLNSNEVQEVYNELYESVEVGEALALLDED